LRPGAAPKPEKNQKRAIKASIHGQALLPGKPLQALYLFRIAGGNRLLWGYGCEVQGEVVSFSG
jgi:hypothetical protein